MDIKIVIIIVVIIAAALIFAGCRKQPGEGSYSGSSGKTYRKISMAEAKEMMARDDGHIIVDVRRQDEYDEGHIPGAVLIPNESIGTVPPGQLPDFDQITLVYCRTGRRAAAASKKLAAMGYTNVYDFGGINKWDGETETGE